MHTQFTWLLAMSILAVLVGCSDAESQKLPNPESVLPKNSCSIMCPDNTAYGGIGASVTCSTNYAPICQCTDADRPAAGCELLNQN